MFVQNSVYSSHSHANTRVTERRPSGACRIGQGFFPLLLQSSSIQKLLFTNPNNALSQLQCYIGSSSSAQSLAQRKPKQSHRDQWEHFPPAAQEDTLSWGPSRAWQSSALPGTGHRACGFISLHESYVIKTFSLWKCPLPSHNLWPTGLFPPV